ncbi:beta-phosphoglucomutase family hydrolase [Promicromonospora soli]
MTTTAAYDAPTGTGVRYAAVIFDMDGVVTDTAGLHALAWQALFDQVLPALSADDGVPSFDIERDYHHHVDGKAREDGVRAVLASRGLTLPDGAPDDTSGMMTVHGLAARKQELFTDLIARQGVVAFPSTVALLHRLRAEGVLTGLVTASRNASEILAAAGVGDLFDARVDGADAATLHLAGKPDPATFTEAARRLGVTPAQAVVIEDAEAGVRAGVAGGFALVVGVDRGGNAARLRDASADVIVADLAALDLTAATVDDRRWCGGADQQAGPWLLSFDGLDPATEGVRETLCTLANGYWGTRGAAPEAVADGEHYPGTYLAGVYNRLHTDIGGRGVEDEAMVNAPNWLPVTYRHPDGDWMRPGGPGVLECRQELDLRRGLLTRIVVYRDDLARTTRVTTRRLVSQAARHLAAMETTFEALDWSGPLQVRTVLDGDVANQGVAEYRPLSDRHLVPVVAEPVDDDTVFLETVTSQSGVHIAMAARTRAHTGGEPLSPPRRLVRDGPARIGHELDLELTTGAAVTVDKVVAVATSRDLAISTPALAARFHLGQAGDFGEPSRPTRRHGRDCGTTSQSR